MRHEVAWVTAGNRPSLTVLSFRTADQAAAWLGRATNDLPHATIVALGEGGRTSPCEDCHGDVQRRRWPIPDDYRSVTLANGRPVDPEALEVRTAVGEIVLAELASRELVNR